MPAHSPAPDDDALDDAIAERIADRLVELAMRPGPVRLHALRMAGLLPPHGCPISQSAIAAGLGTTRWSIRETESRALHRAAAAARKLSPTLNPDTTPQP